jgi:hypothetical protein
MWVFRYGFRLFGGSVGVLREQGKDSSLVKIVPQLAGEVRAAVSDLAALKFEVLQKVGDAVGNIQTYQL